MRIFGVLIFFLCLTCALECAAEDSALQQKISLLTIENRVGRTIKVNINQDFIAYVLPGERYVHNIYVFPGEVYPIHVTAWMGHDETEEYRRAVVYGRNLTPVIFTKDSFKYARWEDQERSNIVLTIVNEAKFPIEIFYEGKRVGVCGYLKSKVLRVSPGVLHVRLLKNGHSKVLAQELFVSNTLTFRERDFLLY